jgi:FixJ family two-component response regulator
VPGVVYVVDDAASFRAAIERRLKKADYEVAVPHFLDRLPRESEPDCILLDVRKSLAELVSLAERVGILVSGIVAQGNGK